MAPYIRKRFGEFVAAYVAAIIGITLVRTLGIYDVLSGQSSITELAALLLSSIAFGLVFGLVGALGIFLVHLFIDSVVLKRVVASGTVLLVFYIIIGATLAFVAERVLEGRVSYGNVTVQYVLSGIVAAWAFAWLVRVQK
jgi:hypothetical protein